MATQDQSRDILSELGYNGPYGAGGAQSFLDSDPTLRQKYNDRIAARDQGYSGSFDDGAYDAWKAGGNGGISPIGVVEPFNDWQKQGLQSLAEYAPQITPQGYMQGSQNAFKDATQASSSLPTTQAFSQGNDLYNTAQDQLSQGTQEFGDQDFASGMQRYFNPYQDQVIDRSVARINEQGNQVRNRLMAKNPGSKSFGTSADAIQLSELDKNLSGQVADTASTLGYQGFNTAAGYARDDFNQARNRNLTAAGQAGNIGASRVGEGFQGFQGLQDLAKTGFAGNDANWNNFAKSRANEDQTIRNKITAGSAVQDQNQKLLDAVQNQYSAAKGFDQQQLSDLAKYLQAFSGGEGATPAALNSTGQLGAGAMFAGGALQSYFNGGGTMPSFAR